MMHVDQIIMLYTFNLYSKKKMKVLVYQLCLTLWNPVDCNPQGPLSTELSRK